MIYRTWLFALLVLCWLPGCVFDGSGLPYSASNNNANTNTNTNDNANTNTNTNDVVCGDDQQEAPEVCDGADLAGQSCQTQGFDGGTLTCLATCAGFDTSACTGTGPECGDGQVEGAEVCDGAALGGRTCQDEGFYSGLLACQSNCTGFDTTGCVGTCGDEIINGTEVCDGTEVGSRTCQDEGFYGGLLGCLTDCSGYNTAGCAGTCGDSTINGTEVCDGTEVGGRTCVDEGFYTGNLGCLGSCAGYDTTPCSGTCGDGIINGTEVCDGAALSGRTCVDEGFYSGDLACLGSCAGYDTTPCSGYCGDGIINGTEECDGGNLGGYTCASLGCRSGTTTCNSNCTVNATACYANHDEDGDGVDDNCDNCPTYPNANQIDADNDEVGGVCEAPFNAGLLSQITAFESLMTTAGLWNTSGGTWTPGTDEVTGTSVPGGGNYLYQTPLPNSDYSVEAMFYMSAATTMDPNWTAVVFGWRAPGGNLSAYECVYERGPNIISIYRTQGGGPWSGIVGKTVATTVTASQWHRLRVYRNGTTVRCAYDDEAGGDDYVEVSGGNVAADMSGRVGLRVYNESTIFTSFVIYQ